MDYTWKQAEADLGQAQGVVARYMAEKGIWWVVMECNMCNMCNIADLDSKKK